MIKQSYRCTEIIITIKDARPGPAQIPSSWAVLHSTQHCQDSLKQFAPGLPVGWAVQWLQNSRCSTETCSPLWAQWRFPSGINFILLSQAISGLPMPSSSHPTITATHQKKKITKCCNNFIWSAESRILLLKSKPSHPNGSTQPFIFLFPPFQKLGGLS